MGLWVRRGSRMPTNLSSPDYGIRSRGVRPFCSLPQARLCDIRKWRPLRHGDSPRIPSGATAACISQCSSSHGKEALLDIRLWLPVPYLGAMMQGRELARLRVPIGQILTVLGIEIQPIAYCQDNH